MWFNATKCYLMSIHRSKHPFAYEYTLNNHALDQVQENPYLGVLICENFKWTKHVNKTSDKANANFRIHTPKFETLQ